MAKEKKERVPKTRGANTYTESAFWGMIRSTLRRRSMFWKPVHLAKLAARRDNQSDNPRLKFEYQCAVCTNWFPEKQTIIDHIIPAGTLTCADDLPSFVERLFCEQEGLRCLCKECHQKITNLQRGNRKKHD
jgi:5-methylcytosine-specific restriction endonuclease McrA